MLLKETGELDRDLFTTRVKEECPKCGSILKTPKKYGNRDHKDRDCMIKRAIDDH